MKSYIQEIPETLEIPETPEILDTPKIPETPEIPEASETSETPEINVYEIFPQRLSLMMTMRDVSTQQLADILCVSRSAISNYRRGFRFPNIQQLYLISIALDSTVDYLLGKSDDLCQSELTDE